jgi:hypothetical protein
MSILSKCSPSRWVDFLTIPNNALELDEGSDLIVGANKSVTLVLKNGSVSQFRDIVVLGELIVRSADPNNTEIQASLVANNIFVIGRFTIRNLQIFGENMYQAKDKASFYEDVRKLFLESLEMQRECVREIGLKSLLNV